MLDGNRLPAIGCPTAPLLPARVAIVGDSLVLVLETSDPITVVWPTGWVAWRLGGRTDLASRDRTLIGREGDSV